MNDFDNKVMKEYAKPRFEYWKQFLKPQEISVFTLYYFEKYSIVKISITLNYSEIQIKRILKSARKKIYKHIP